MPLHFFLERVSERALGTTALKSPPQGGSQDRRPELWGNYQKLLSELPDIVHQKVFEKDMVADLQRSVVV